MSSIYRKFKELPVWTRWFSPFIVLSIIGGFEEAWGTKKFISNFTESAFAYSLYWGSIGVSIFGGFLAYRAVIRRVNNKFLAWILALTIFLIIGTVLGLLISEIPGVGWRYEALIT